MAASEVLGLPFPPFPSLPHFFPFPFTVSRCRLITPFRDSAQFHREHPIPYNRLTLVSLLRCNGITFTETMQALTYN